MKKILFLFLFILAINSCKKDEGDIVAPGNEYTPKVITETYGNAKLVGFVNDKSGNPLSGVTVFFGEEKTTTGSDGGYQLNTLSAGTNKRIWFQKSGYASTQKLADIKEDLPNRIDASLFPIDKTEKMNSGGGKIEGKDFSVEIKPGGFVYSDGRPVDEDVTAEVTAFLTSEGEFLDAFPGEFRGTRENGTETAIESFGFIDVVLKVKSGEPVQLAEGVTAIIKIKAPENSPTSIPMWHYDEDKAQWIEEGVGSLVDGLYIAEVNHFTRWNWDLPIETRSKIVGRVVDNSGNPIEGASLIQTGVNRNFQLTTKSIDDGTFEMFTLENFKSKIEAQFDIYGSTIINYTTSSNKAHVNNIGDITFDVNIENIIEPLVSNNVLYITIGQSARIRGNYFGKEKRASYKLLLNGNEVETITWQSDLIEFVIPNGIYGEGVIQIDRDGTLSRKVNYEEGEWSCEIDGIIYDNNDLPIYYGRYSLRLEQSYLSEIPNCIGNLQNLESFYLTDNPLESLPESLGNLQNLEILHLYELNLRSLPESIGNLQNIKELFLYWNRLISLPESIGNLKKLKVLRLFGNNLSSLPESIGNLQNLENLYLFDNKLNSLPESIGNLQNLKELVLYKNKLNSLPESIGNLHSLESLWIDNNQLSSLPESIKNLKDHLDLIHLEGNNFSEEEKAKIEEWLPGTEIYW